MINTAVPAGETAPDVFFLDMRQVAWDGTAGVTLTAPSGHGRGDLLALIALRALVRGCASARLLAAAMGAGV
jgi:hypothetical protein